MSISSPANRFRATNTTLELLIANAYRIDRFRIQGGSDWVRTERFDVDAKSERPTSSDESAAMLRALLEDRFKLKVRVETRQSPVYLLTVAKGGPKLQLSKDGERPMMSGGRGKLSFQNLSISNLTRNFSGQLERMVLDRTGLEGNFTFTLEWNPDLQGDSGTNAPSLFTAVQEQLGLRLESARGDVETLIIDSAEKPTEN